MPKKRHSFCRCGVESLNHRFLHHKDTKDPSPHLALYFSYNIIMSNWFAISKGTFNIRSERKINSQYLFATGKKYNALLLQMASQKGIQNTYFLLQLTDYVVLFQSGRGACGIKENKDIKICHVGNWNPDQKRKQVLIVAHLSSKFLTHIH